MVFIHQECAVREDSALKFLKEALRCFYKKFTKFTKFTHFRVRVNGIWQPFLKICGIWQPFTGKWQPFLEMAP